jgi:pyruvate/2-oxoglutarate dehydrogenase complex dihydrolipoamide acyltransferase (E2) component
MAENTEKKEVKTKKAPAAKAAAKKETAATKKASTAKPTAAKKPAAKKTKAATSDLEQRYKLIEVAAYYIAEKDGFAASPVDYWIAAELQISK